MQSLYLLRPILYTGIRGKLSGFGTGTRGCGKDVNLLVWINYQFIIGSNVNVSGK